MKFPLRLYNRFVPTPTYLIHTKDGQVPYLIPQLLETISKNILISYNFWELTEILDLETIRKYRETYPEKNISHYLGYFEFPSIINLTHGNSSFGRNAKKITGWSRAGVCKFDRKEFNEYVKLLNPHLFLSMWDETEYQKNERNVVLLRDKKIEYDVFEQNYQSYYSHIINTPLMNTVGVQIPTLRRVSFDEKLKIVKKFYEEGKEKKESDFFCPLRFTPNSGHPMEILELVDLGIDFFDGDYPFRLANLGFASTFRFLFDQKEEEKSKKMKDEEEIEGEDEMKEEEREGDVYKLNLRDRKFELDFSPLVKDCQCVCCKEHTRGYIHHLLNCKESLGTILLTIHNLHHYLSFFQEIRKRILNSGFLKYKELFEDENVLG